MRITKIILSILILVTFTGTAMASNWVDDFLARYQPIAGVNSAPAPAVQNAGQLFATGTVPVTLNDVINMMIERNLDIRSNRLSPRTSYFQSLVFYRALQPSLRLAGTVAHDTAVSTTQLNGAISRAQLTGAYAANFSQLLPTGTSLAVDLTMNRTSSNSNNNIFNPSYTGRITYTVGQHLLRDRGNLVNTRQIVIGQNNEKMSEIQFEIQVVNLLVQAQKTYWDFVFANQDLDVKQRSLGLAQQTLEENKTKVEIGTLAPIDVVQTQADVASRQEQLVISTYNVTSAEDQIKKMTSSDKDPAMFLIKLQAQDLPRRPEAVQIPTLEGAIQIALENRPEMRQSQLDLKNKDIDVAYTQNQKLPVFDVTASYSQNGTGGEKRRDFALGSAPLVTPIPGGVFDAFRQLFGYNFTGYAVGFSFIMPLSNKAAEADHDRALNEKRLSQSKLDVTAQQIALEVRNALTQVEMNRARIDTAQATRALAEQKLDAEQTKFNLGTSTLRFVLEEQRNVAQAQSNELQTVVNFTKSLVDLDRSMGLTLRNSNVEIDKTLGPVASKATLSTTAN